MRHTMVDHHPAPGSAEAFGELLVIGENKRRTTHRHALVISYPNHQALTDALASGRTEFHRAQLVEDAS